MGAASDLIRNLILATLKLTGARHSAKAGCFASIGDGTVQIFVSDRKLFERVYIDFEMSKTIPGHPLLLSMVD
jgi:hypothetical protein